TSTFFKDFIIPGAASSSPDCPQCPQHILTGAEAAMSYSQFCEAFGFPMGPSGARALRLFYELWGPSGTLVQRGQASNCLAQGQHPEPLLFDHQGNVDIVCIYSTSYCTVTTRRARSPPARPTVWTTKQASAAWLPSGLDSPSAPSLELSDRVNAIQISAITGIGPAFLDLPLRTYTEPVERTHTPQAFTLLSPPHLNTSMHISTPQPRVVNAPLPAYLHPINVVRHVRMPPPWRGQPQSPPSSSGFFSPLLSLRLPGRLVEIVREVEKEVRTAVCQSQHRDLKRGRSRRK
uniref:Uncharacterized protein n=1 Tax=Oncorhynchus tshawytscha TaxID=74940 RepID=A0A8C8J684_ONCTS